MRIDKSKIEAMVSLSDNELWNEIKSVAEAHGVKMPDKQPSTNDLSKVREALSEADKLNLMTAMKLVNNLKKGNK